MFFDVFGRVYLAGVVLNDSNQTGSGSVTAGG
jgi:hypothetical protein